MRFLDVQGVHVIVLPTLFFCHVLSQMPLLVSLPQVGSSQILDPSYGTRFITEKVLELPMTFFISPKDLKKKRRRETTLEQEPIDYL